VTNAAGDIVCTTEGSLSCVVSGLAGKGPFVFIVTAHNVVGSGPTVRFTARVTPLACGTKGARKCATHSRTVRFGVVYFATNQYSIVSKGTSHATLVAAARSIVAHNVRSVTVTGTTDVRGNLSKNRVLSLRRARSTVAALRTLLRSMHYKLPRFVVKAVVMSTKYQGLPLNRRATIAGVIRV
jgi:hypothetical protein